MILYGLSLLLPILAAYAAVSYCDRDAPTDAAALLLRCSLAVGIAIGASSLIFFFWMFLFGMPDAIYCLCEATLFAVAALGFERMSHRSGHGRVMKDDAPKASQYDACRRTQKAAFFRKCITTVFVVVVVFAAAGTIGIYLQYPIGDWDAWAIWNLRARCMYRLGDQWPQAFSGPYTHCDYPLLVPCGNLRAWMYLGGEQLWASWLLGVMLTFAAVGVLTASVARMRGRTQGLLAGLTLLGMTPFLRRGAMQYADVPLAFYIIAAVVPLALQETPPRPRRRWLILSGLMAGMAAWTKNEGLLLLLVLPSAYGCIRWRQFGCAAAVKEMFIWIAGTLPALTAVSLQKICLASANELLAGQNFHDTLGKLLDPIRYFEIVRFLASNMMHIAGPFLVVLPLCFLCLGAAKKSARCGAGVSTAALTASLLLAGYFIVYLTTPCDLIWHLRTSANRLLLHILPLFLLVLFNRLATPEEVWTEQATCS